MTELVIKLNDETYKEVIDRTEFDTLVLGIKLIEAVQNGTLLPKKHGDLIDRDELVYDCSLGNGGCDHICRCDGCSYNIIRETTINKATPIIEADKGENE